VIALVMTARNLLEVLDAHHKSGFRESDSALRSATRNKGMRQTAERVRDCIREGFDLKTDFLSGSYMRHTKTKPLKDVDIMFVLGSKENGGG